MVGPSLLCVLGYLGWRYYGAPNLDRAYYGLKLENIHVSPQPAWLKKSNVLEEVYRGGSLGNLSLLDGQTPANLARVFNAHPSVRQTLQVQPIAGGQVMVNLEYRMPVALVCFPAAESGSSEAKDVYLPVDQDAVLLDTANFTSEDVRQYISIYTGPEKISKQWTTGKPIGDVRVEEAVRLCAFLMRYREATRITQVYVYKSPVVGKTSWRLELVTANGPRILWGSTPGMEGPGEPTANTKLQELLTMARDNRQWSKPEIILDGTLPQPTK
jgi:hypothetical protein